MKTLNITIVAFAILIFSGCYTQLLIEDDPPAPANAQPVVNQPAPPTEILYVADPQPVFVPVYIPANVPPGYSSPSAPAPAPAPVHRPSGVQRSGAENSQASSQETRNSGATRGGRR